jgi:cation:H+ antiporter
MTKTACPTDKPLGRRAVSTTAKKLVGKCPPYDFIVFWILIFGHLILFLCTFTGKKRVLDRWESYVLLALYAGYIYFLIVQR